MGKVGERTNVPFPQGAEATHLGHEAIIKCPKN